MAMMLQSMKQLRTLGGKTLQRRFLHASPLLAQARLVKGLTPEEAEKYEFQPVQPKHQVVWDGVKEENQWTEESRRVGVVALKCGMVAEYDEWGQRVPLTVLKLENVQVVQVKDNEDRECVTVQVGAGEAKPKRVKKTRMGHFTKHGVPPKISLCEFKVSRDALLPVGTEITAQHFVPGQFVDVSGKSQGKGFQGPMKRWGFGGLFASHGVSKSHRSHGSTGQCQDPGKVFKGKKMAGQMGGRTRTVQGLQVYKVDYLRNLVYVKGAVPGTKGGYLKLYDSTIKPFHAPPPFPTYLPTAEELEARQKYESGFYLTPEEVFDATLLNEAVDESRVPPPYEVIMPRSETDPFNIRATTEPEMQI